MAKLLLENGANPSLKTPVGGIRDEDEPKFRAFTALHFAAYKEDMDILRILIARRAYVNATDYYGKPRIFSVLLPPTTLI